MGKTSVKVNCIDQRLLVSSGPVIASGGHNEDELIFSFCPLWDGYEKIATFYRDKDQVYHAIIESDKCVIPWEVLTNSGEFYFGVFGVKNDVQRTSHVVKYKVAEGAISEDTAPSDPTPDIYTQIISAHNDVSTRLQNHTGDTENPHGVTAAQVGALSLKGGTVTGNVTVTGKTTLNDVTLNKALTVASDSVAAQIRKNLNIAEVDSTVTADSANPVSGKAVTDYVTAQLAAILNFEEVAF